MTQIATGLTRCNVYENDDETTQEYEWSDDDADAPEDE